MTGGKRRVWIAAICVLALVAIIAVGLARLRSSVVATFQLRDGAIVSIRRATYGNIHQYDIGKPWQVLAAKILPEKLSKRFGVSAGSVSLATTNKTTVVFVETTDTKAPFTGAGGPPLGILMPQIVNAQISDGTGNEFALTLLRGSNFLGRTLSQAVSLKFSPLAHGYQVASNRWVDAVEIPAEGLLSTKMQLRLNFQVGPIAARVPGGPPPEMDPYYQRVDSVVPNPAPRHNARLVVPPLPQATNLGDLQIELVELALYPRPRRQFPTNNSTNVSTRARLRFTENGVESTNWRVVSMAVRDPGGFVYGGQMVLAVRPDRETIQVGAGFSPLQPRYFRFRLGRADAPLRPSPTDRFVEFLARPSPPATNIVIPHDAPK